MNVTWRTTLSLLALALPAVAAAEEAASFEEGMEIPIAIGILVFGLTYLRYRLRKQRYERRAATRDEKSATKDSAPWRKKRQWMTGVIESRAGFRLKLIWGLAAFLSFISIGTVKGIVKVLSSGGSPGILALGLFPIIAIALIVMAVRHTIRWRRYGRAFFHIQSETGVVGGSLRGKIVSIAPVQGKADFILKLECVEQLRRKKIGSDGWEAVREVRWSTVDRIPPAQVNLQAGLPVKIDIPKGVRETDDPHSEGPVSWWLTLSELSKGVDFVAEFEVPVYEKI